MEEWFPFTIKLDYGARVYMRLTEVFGPCAVDQVDANTFGLSPERRWAKLNTVVHFKNEADAIYAKMLDL